MAPEVKTAKNSKLPKLSEICFEPVGKGGWPQISIWINKSPWTPNFNLELEITKTLVWVRLPHLPLILWDDDSLRKIKKK
jgi:hypothetical protein